MQELFFMRKKILRKIKFCIMIIMLVDLMNIQPSILFEYHY